MTRIHISDLFRLPTALTVLALLAAAATAQPGPEEAATAGIGGWKLEEVRTADGHTYRGLLDK
ncbi:MAG: hypothetical protein KDA41_21800, partial [Planctomycetales bacterium]|nr:hypothetical protein [Planctomycetales bacterium]